MAKGVGSSGCSAGVVGNEDGRPLPRMMGVGCTAGAGPERELAVELVVEGGCAGWAIATGEVVSGDTLLLLIVTGEDGVGGASRGSCMEG